MVNKRQFVISHREHSFDGSKYLKLSNGFIISYHHTLNIKPIGKNCFLLGYAFSCKGEELLIDEKQIEESIRYWAGRWVLITADTIFMDAAGTLGLFYGYDENHELICSSSLGLLRTLIPHSEWISNVELKRHMFGWIDYYPSPYTPWSGCKALLPSQKIDLITQKIKPRNDYDFTRFLGENKEKLIEDIISIEGIILKNISKYFKKVYIPLTAGVDSRTILANAIHSHVDVNLYSIRRMDTPIWDIKVPQMIARKLGIPYTLFEENRTNDKIASQRRRNIDLHCGGPITVGTEISQYLNEIDVGENNVVLWGPLWEIGIHYYSQYLPKEAVDANAKEIISYIDSKAKKNSIHSSKIHELSLAEWADQVIQQPIRGVNWMDRLYWEQRVGAWVKNSFQMIDMFDSDRIIPVNCLFLLEHLIAFDPDYNTSGGKEAQKDIIRKCVPKLGDISYGDSGYFFYKTWYKIRSKIRMLTNS